MERTDRARPELHWNSSFAGQIEHRVRPLPVLDKERVGNKTDIDPRQRFWHPDTKNVDRHPLL
jgi:hypothetical protein